MPAIIDKILRIGEGKILRQLETISKAINAIEDDFVAMSDDELRGMTDEFKKRLADGETFDDIMPEAFATVREASRRVTGMREQPGSRPGQCVGEQPFGIDAIDGGGGLVQQGLDGCRRRRHAHSVASRSFTRHLTQINSN